MSLDVKIASGRRLLQDVSGLRTTFVASRLVINHDPVTNEMQRRLVRFNWERLMQALGEPRLYLALAVIGVIIPYAALLPWIGEHGFAPDLFFRQAFETRIAAFAWLDVIVSAVAVLSAAAMATTGRRLVPIVTACLLVGVSAALPLFLYFLAKSPK